MELNIHTVKSVAIRIKAHMKNEILGYLKPRPDRQAIRGIHNYYTQEISALYM